MTDYNKFYIDGNWIEPDGTEKVNVINPASEKVICNITCDGT